MMTFRSEWALNQYLKQCATEAVNILTDRIYNKLIEFIQEDIYDTYPEPEFPIRYDRTYQFKEKAWIKEMATEISNAMVSSINYFPSGMVYNQSKGQHGSPWGKDRRKELAAILNRGGTWDWTDWDWGRVHDEQSEGYRIYPKPFWDDTIEWILDNWDKEVIKAFKQVGLNVKKG